MPQNENMETTKKNVSIPSHDQFSFM